MIIFNPTWTPPDSPWVDTMNVTPGEVIGAGNKQNPLGPIKIPIGSPSLIHGGKPLAKIGTFASHGCIGDRKSTRLNSSHTVISYAVFCLKKKKRDTQQQTV